MKMLTVASLDGDISVEIGITWPVGEGQKEQRNALMATAQKAVMRECPSTAPNDQTSVIHHRRSNIATYIQGESLGLGDSESRASQ